MGVESTSMLYYKIANQILSSDLAFPELTKCNDVEPASKICLTPNKCAGIVSGLQSYHTWFQEDENIWARFYRQGSVCFIEYPGHVIFEINLHQIKYEIIGPIAEADFRHLFLDQVFPHYLSLKDYLVLHASAVSIDEKALIFIGNSGAGKSTIVSLLRNYFQVVSDDFVPCQITQQQVVVLPSYPIVRLWEQPKNLTGLAELTNLHGSDKLRYHLNDFYSEALEARALFVLKRDENLPKSVLKIQPLPAEELFQAVLASIFVLDNDQQQRQIWLLEKISYLTNLLKGFTLTYSDLHDVSDKLYEIMKQHV
jgi:hypothetical protein